MASTRKSSTKSGGSKAARSTKCARTKSKSTSTKTSKAKASEDESRSCPTSEPIEPAQLPSIEVSIPPAVTNQVVGWMLLGHSGHDVTEAVREKLPAYRVGDVLAAAAEHFRRAGVADPDAVRGFCIEFCRSLIRDSLRIGDLGTALKAIKELRAVAAQ